MFFAVPVLIKFVDDLASNIVPIHFSKSGGKKTKESSSKNLQFQ